MARGITLTPCKAVRVRSGVCVSARISEPASACLPACSVSTSLWGAEASSKAPFGGKFEEKAQEAMSSDQFTLVLVFSHFLTDLLHMTSFLCPSFAPSLHPCGADVASLFTLGTVNPWPFWLVVVTWILQTHWKPSALPVLVTLQTVGILKCCCFHIQAVSAGGAAPQGFLGLVKLWSRTTEWTLNTSACWQPQWTISANCFQTKCEPNLVWGQSEMRCSPPEICRLLKAVTHWAVTAGY